MMTSGCFLICIYHSTKNHNFPVYLRRSILRRRVLLFVLAVEDDELHQRGRESVYSGREPVH